MWYSTTVAAPTDEPVTIDQVKAQCRIDGSDEDEWIDRSIKAARAHVEKFCGVRFAARAGVTLKCDYFSDFAALPEVPVTSVTVAYVDTAGATQTLATSVYELRADGLCAAIVLKSGQVWPSILSGSRITVTAAIGYSEIPPDVMHAILLLISHWYEKRGATSEAQEMPIPYAFDDLLTNNRVWL